MEETHLVCDRCPEAKRKHAAGRYTLHNGRGPKPLAGLDLCERHTKELLRAFKVRGVPKAKGQHGGARVVGETRDTVLAYLKGKAPQTRAEIAKGSGIGANAVTNALVRLRAYKQVKSTGAGRRRTWGATGR
jgi:hypothetical protein